MRAKEVRNREQEVENEMGQERLWMNEEAGGEEWPDQSWRFRQLRDSGTI